jgi:hypothetical protein
MALTGRRPPEIFFSAPSAFFETNTPILPSSSTVNSKLGQAPGTSSDPYPIPWKPGRLRSAYGAICCHRFKPQTITDDIFLAQILGHKLLDPMPPFLSGRVMRIFTFESLKTSPYRAIPRYAGKRSL